LNSDLVNPNLSEYGLRSGSTSIESLQIRPVLICLDEAHIELLILNHNVYTSEGAITETDLDIRWSAVHS
jgi:hypothetical protein